MMELTVARMAELTKVNQDVNDSVQYVTDMQNYGLEEYWAVAGTKGDCEDYALKKLKLLRGLGWAKEDLNIMICTIAGQGHAVLGATTSAGDYVLDNNLDVPTLWYKCNYTWVMTSVAGDFLQWKEITE